VKAVAASSFACAKASSRRAAPAAPSLDSIAAKAVVLLTPPDCTSLRTQRPWRSTPARPPRANSVRSGKVACSIVCQAMKLALERVPRALMASASSVV
jgi:hypothetical protein